MAGESTNYQCPSCMAPLHFSSDSGMLVCDYCDSQYSVEDIDRMLREKAANEGAEQAEEGQHVSDVCWEMDAAGQDWDADADTIRAYRCSSCGAELICESTTVATSCPYCGNTAIIAEQLSGSKKPDYVIPFKFSKEEAIAALKKHYGGKFLLPKEFKSKSHIEQITGIYVPFWLFDAEVEADITFHTTRVRYYSTASHNITETNHYLVHRQGSLSFSHVPVDGSSKMPDALMDSIEPFNFHELVPFSMSYLPGFLADKYDMDSQSCVQRVNGRCETSTEQALRDTVIGYSSCITAHKDVNITSQSVKYALLPVWMLSTRWNDKNYLFAMNGQTGKLVGDLPIHYGKLALSCAGAFAAAALLTLLL